MHDQSVGLDPVAFRWDEEHIFPEREMTQQRDFSEHTTQLIDEDLLEIVRSEPDQRKHGNVLHQIA